VARSQPWRFSPLQGPGSRDLGFQLFGRGIKSAVQRSSAVFPARPYVGTKDHRGHLIRLLTLPHWRGRLTLARAIPTGRNSHSIRSNA
jgi:hypothetical protein